MLNMKKAFVLPPAESWIVDRLVDEFKHHAPNHCTDNILEADVIWLCADWCWRRVPIELLRAKKVVTTVHHIVLEKWVASAELRRDFFERDSITDLYHVPNERTAAFVRAVTTRPVHVLGYWANDSLWRTPETKQAARDRLFVEKGVPPSPTTLIGSFQRDTEGSDLVSPKLEKGPDIFCDHVIARRDSGERVHVLLAGWRRQYVMNRLREACVGLTYEEMPSLQRLALLYRSLDEYVVSSRCEGGPQAFLECGLMGTPVRTTPVGIAEQVMHPTSINQNLMLAKPTIPDVSSMLIKDVVPKYVEMLGLS